MADVGSGVLKGLDGERASSPVSPLKSFALINGYAQQISGEGCQAELGNASKTGGDTSIELVMDVEVTMTLEAADVVVRPMKDFLDGIIYQNVSERSEVIKRYRIDDIDFVAGGDLNEAELLGVVVEAVGLGINGDGL